MKNAILVRMHKLELFRDLLGFVPERTDEISKAMRKIIKEKTGIIVILGAESLKGRDQRKI